MPWQVKKQGDQYCVVKEGSGETVKCHESKEKALSHVRALYANVHDSAFSELSMSIIKVATKNGEMTWRSVNSDIDEDVFGERMSLELFQDFEKHIQGNEAIPEPFKDAICEEDWCGGMPYVSLAHYKSGKNKVNVPGEPKSVYTDGKAFKSTGILYDTPLGRSVYKSLKKDLTEKSVNPVRISIGFLDLEHSHGEKFTFTRKSLSDKCPLCKEGIGDKIYKKGHLVHLALTRVPANPRTEMVLKSMPTKLEDAKSIVEDEEVLETLELKSQTENDVLVIKAKDHMKDDMEGHMDEEEEKEGKKKKPFVKESVVDKTTENTVLSAPANIPAPIPETFTVTGIPEPTPVQKSFAALVEKMSALKTQGLTGDAALAEIQKNFDELGNVVKSEFTPKLSPEEEAKKNLEITLRSLLGEMLPQALAQVVAPLQSELGELRALSQARPVIRKEEIPQRRGLDYNLVQKAAIETLVNKHKPKDQFQAIADQSVGLTQ